MEREINMEKSGVKSPAKGLLQQLGVEVTAALLIGVSTNFTPYHLYDFMGYSDFPLHFIYVTLGTLALAFLAAYKYPAKGVGASMLIFSSIYFGTLLGIIIGISVDPTSHNLWPFEVIMNLIYFVPALIGSAIGFAIQKLKK